MYKWRGDETDHYCWKCSEAGYVPPLMLEDHQESQFIRPFNIGAVACFSSDRKNFVSVPNRGLCCTTCFEKTSDLLGRVKQGTYHLTTTIEAEATVCFICKAKIFVEKNPRPSNDCRANCLVRRKIMQNDGCMFSQKLEKNVSLRQIAGKNKNKINEFSVIKSK